MDSICSRTNSWIDDRLFHQMWKSLRIQQDHVLGKSCYSQCCRRSSLYCNSCNMNRTDQCKKGNAIPVQACYRPRGFQEVEAPRFPDNQHLKVVSLSACPPLPHRKHFYYSFLLEAESIPGPECDRKDYVKEWYHRESRTRSSAV